MQKIKPEKNSPEISKILLKEMLLNRSGVQVPVHEHRHKKEVGGEGKRSLLRGWTIWGSRGIPGPGLFSHKTEKKLSPRILKSKTKLRNFPCILICPLEYKVARQTAFWLPFFFPGVCACRANTALPCHSCSHSRGLGLLPTAAVSHVGATCMGPMPKAVHIPWASEYSGLCSHVLNSEQEQGHSLGLSMWHGASPSHGLPPKHMSSTWDSDEVQANCGPGTWGEGEGPSFCPTLV